MLTRTYFSEYVVLKSVGARTKVQHSAEVCTDFAVVLRIGSATLVFSSFCLLLCTFVENNAICIVMTIEKEKIFEL